VGSLNVKYFGKDPFAPTRMSSTNNKETLPLPASPGVKRYNSRPTARRPWEESSLDICVGGGVYKEEEEERGKKKKRGKKKRGFKEKL
jgi:hypothetical protein